MAAEKKNTIRALSAVIGGGALLTLGWLSASSGGQGTPLAIHTPPPPPTMTSGAMTLGATTTMNLQAPATAVIQRAQPNITGPAALPSEEAGLP